MSRKATGCNAVSGDATSFVNPASTGDPTPTTSAGDSGTDTTSVDSIETGTEPGSSTTADQPEAPPTIVSFDVEPDLVEDNGLIEIEVATENADGVRMALETGEVIELVPGMVGGFIGQIDAFTALDNGEHIAALTPWREGIDGVSVPTPYYIALPDPGQQTAWETGDLIGSSGFVVAMGVLPDRRFVELGTYYLQGEPRCFVRVRGLDNKWGAADMVSVLPTSYRAATDLTVNPETGALQVLVDRKGDGGLYWWLGEI